MKGAPERILDRCTTILNKGKEEAISGEHKKKINKAIQDMGYMGERVLGFADLILPSSNYPSNFVYNTEKVNFPLTGLRFCGLMSMIDPARPGVPEAVNICKQAGIKVYMVTGDHPITAMAIARKVGKNWLNLLSYKRTFETSHNQVKIIYVKVLFSLTNKPVILVYYINVPN